MFFKNMLRKFLLFFKKPRRIIIPLSQSGILNWVSDESFIKFQYRILTGKKLNLNTPKTYNEKIQWLKLYGNQETYSYMVDKYEVRKYIKDKIGEEYLIPLLGVWDKFENIDFNILPNQFVLKCTHDSGSILVVKDKSELNYKNANIKLNKTLKHNYYYDHRETQYKNIIPKIICEKYMKDLDSVDLIDYKIFCFNGKPLFLCADYNRFTNHQKIFFDTNWNYIPVKNEYPNNFDLSYKKPEKFDELLEIARKLSKDLVHVRVDLYIINNSIYFGELTFSNMGGFSNFEPDEYNYKFGDFLQLN